LTQQGKYSTNAADIVAPSLVEVLLALTDFLTCDMDNDKSALSLPSLMVPRIAWSTQFVDFLILMLVKKLAV